MIANKALPTATRVVILCLGYGCLLACAQWGILGVSYLSALGVGWGSVLATQSVFALTTGATLMVFRVLARGGVMFPRVFFGVACVLGYAFCLTTSAWVVDSLGLLCCLWAAMGALAAPCLLTWFDAILFVYQEYGRGLSIVAISGSGCVSLLLSVLVGLVGRHELVLALVMGALLISVFLREVFALTGGGAGATLADGHESGVTHGSGSGATGFWFGAEAPLFRIGTRGRACTVGDCFYRLTAYGVAILVSFGATSSLANSGSVFMFAELGGPGALVGLPATLVGLLTCVAFVAVGLFCKEGGSRFGLLIRLFVAATGILLIVAPVMAALAPCAMALPFRCASLLQGIAMTFFSIEVSQESGLGIVEVMPLNISVFFAATATAAGLFWWIATYVGGHLLWDLFAVFVAVVSLAIIPLLPSASSTAMAFTLSVLPENEGYEARSLRSCRAISARCGLSEREGEVLELLLRGMTRAEIAQELSLSSWTVKDYISDIYGKVGVHSAKELMVLAAGGDCAN